MVMEVDFLIVGQGLAGSLLAYEMQKQGLSYRIIGSKKRNASSFISAGMYNPLVFKRITKSWQVDSLLPVMESTYQELEELLGKHFFYKKDIIKPIKKIDEEKWLLKAADINFSSYIKEVGIDCAPNGTKEQYSWVKVTRSGYCDLQVMLSSLTDYFYHQGTYIETIFEYEDLGFIDSMVTWHGLQAKTIVFCEGSHAIRNPYFNKLGFNTTKGEILEIEANDLSEDFIYNKKIFALPLGGNLFKVGATYEWKFDDENVSMKCRTQLIKELDELIDTPYIVTNHFAGVRPTVVDRRPILGKYPSHSQIAIFNCLGTRGVMLAPFYAKEMLHFLLEPDYEVDDEVSVRRFKDFK